MAMVSGKDRAKVFVTHVQPLAKDKQVRYVRPKEKEEKVKKKKKTYRLLTTSMKTD